MRTQIILPSSGVIDLYDDVPISYNFNAAEIRQPEKGVADYTKTIVIPGTKNNHKLFHNQFDINLDSIYDTRMKLACSVVVDDVEIMRGYIRLLRIIQKGRDDYDYEISIIGNVANIFKDIGGDELTELDLSRLNHTWNIANITASWSAATGVGYLYPFMDNGNWDISFPNQFSVNNFWPAIYLKEYIDRIFEFYGYQYQSTFFNSNFFKRLIIPFSESTAMLTAAAIAAREVRTSRMTSQQAVSLQKYIAGFVTIGNPDFNDDSTAPNTDPSNQHDEVGDPKGITIANRGYYIFRSVIYFEADFTLSSSVIIEKLEMFAQIFVTDSAGLVKYAVEGPVVAVTSNTIHTELFTLTVSTQAILLEAGDFAEVSIYYQSDLSAATTGRLKIGSYFQMKSDGNITAGGLMTINSVIPKMKISDLLSSLKKMFNLYFSIDKDISNKYIIEPRDDWYSTTKVDWSSKLDISKNVEVIPAGDLEAKRYIFKYKPDSDYYNSLYQGRYDEPYGTRKKTVDTDIIKADYIIEPSFSPSPLHSDNVSDRVFARVRTKDNLPGSAPTRLIKTNFRMLYFGVLLSCDSYKIFTQVGSTNDPSTQTTYPFCGHIDHPIYPSLDLSFGVPKEIYYLATSIGATYTNNNLYNVYWRNFIDEVTDKNSRIILAYFNLTVADIADLDPRKLYYFKGELWRLNKIVDYNPLSSESTKCEFTKVRTAENGFN